MVCLGPWALGQRDRGLHTRHRCRATLLFAGRSTAVLLGGFASDLVHTHLQSSLEIRDDELMHAIASNVDRGDAAAAGGKAGQGITKATSKEGTRRVLL